MDFEIDTSGFDELKDKLEELGGEGDELDNLDKIPLPDLFPKTFMRKYTEFEDIKAFLEKSNLEIESNNEFDDISDEFVNSNTQFNGTEEMFSKGVQLWAKRQLDL